MIDANAIADLQMLMNIGDGRQAVLAELLDTPPAPVVPDRPTGRPGRPYPGRSKLKIRSLPGQSLPLLPHLRNASEDLALPPEGIIALLDRLPSKEKKPLVTFAEGLAYYYNNLFMGLIGHFSIIMYRTSATHEIYERLRQCEERVLNTASVIRLLLDVFHRSECRKTTLYPIDLSDREISRRIFTSPGLSPCVRSLGVGNHGIQEVLNTIAGSIAGRLHQTLDDLERQIRQAFATAVIPPTCDHHHRQAMRYLRKGQRFARYLLEFAGRVEVHRQPHDLVAILTEASEIYQFCFAQLRFQTELNLERALVNADRDLLRKAFLDLIDLDGDTSEPSRNLRIRLKAIHSKPSRRSGNGKAFVNIDFCHVLPPGSMYDPLCALDPFEAVANRYRCNLGPAAASGIIRRHGGIIRCKSEDRRLTFSIYLPMTEAVQGTKTESEPKHFLDFRASA